MLSVFMDYLQGRSLDWQVKAVYSLVLAERDLLTVQPTGAGESLVVHGTVAIEEGFVLHVVPLLALGAD